MNPDDILMPSWLSYWFIVLGLFQIFFGVMASRGAVKAKTYIMQGRVNIYLNIFLLFMTIVLLCELFCVLIIVVKQSGWDQEDVNKGSDFVVDYLEDSLTTEFEKRDSFWWEVQKSWE